MIEPPKLLAIIGALGALREMPFAMLILPALISVFAPL